MRRRRPRTWAAPLLAAGLLGCGGDETPTIAGPSAKVQVNCPKSGDPVLSEQTRKLLQKTQPLAGAPSSQPVGAGSVVFTVPPSGSAGTQAAPTQGNDSAGGATIVVATDCGGNKTTTSSLRAAEGTQ